MNLETSAAAARARSEASEWLEDWLPADYDERFLQYRLDLPFRSRYQAAAFDAGWLNPAWPSELGGQELDEESAFWVKLDFSRRRAPKMPNVQGPGVIAHALGTFGSQEQRKFIRDVARGDSWWCLGMSEPGAGSDLASMRTQARKVTGGYAVSGQKVWTSHAHQSTHCLLFAKTNPEAVPQHKGISAFVVPMDSAGITVRKIDKIGPEDEEFCEVFFDSVALPDEALLGELNGGWKVAMTSLSHERDMIWMMNLAEAEHALALAKQQLNGPAHGAEYAQHLAATDAVWLTGVRALGLRLAGKADTLTPLLKLASTELAQRAFLFAARVKGLPSVLTGDANWTGAEVAAGEFEALGATLYGGTSEIQRNIIAERILGLPRT